MSIGNAPEAPDQDRPSVGRALQKARIDSRLTVEEVSTSTRVRVPIVHAIEADDFSRCGGDVYARGHIRTLARAVGLDPETLIAQYDEEHGGRQEATPTAALFEAERIRSEPRRPNWTAAMVAAIVAVVGFVGFTIATGGDDASRTPVAEEPAEKPDGQKPDGQKPDGEPGRNDRPEPRPDPSDSAIAGVPADKVTVRMEADAGNSWISAADHTGKVLFEGVLEKGTTKTFTDDEQLDLVVGNAGAVQLWVNGKEVERLGEVDTVERVTYTKGDPEQG